MKPAIRPRLLAVAVVTSFLLVTGSLAGGAPALADAGDAAFTATPMPTLNAPVVNKRDVASPGTWVPTPDSLSFQWFENGIAIDGTGSESPLFGPDDQGAQITVAVTATKAGYASQTETSAPVTVLGAITATSVAIDGVPKPGETLTADGSFDPSDSTVSYAWMDQNGWIPGATSQTYVPTEAEAGHNISVDFRVSHDGYQATSFGRWVQITYATFQPPLNILTGDVHIGSTVQAPQESSWFPQPTTLTYQWMRGSADIPGATGPSHIVTNGDIGYVLHVRETGSRAGYPDATWTSPPTTEVLADFDQITTPVIVGTPEVGVPLTVKEAPWTPAATNWGTEWYVNGVATGDGGNLIPSAGDIGATITAEVYGWSGTRAVDISPLSAPTAPVRANTYKLGAVTIGVVDLNRTVGATFTKPSASATLSYQWMINGSAIAGATKSTYLPEGGNWHKNLSVRITVSGSGYTTSVGVSNSELVRDGTLEEPGFPLAQIVPGEQVSVGATLHAESVGWNISGLKIRYKWLDLNAGPMNGTYGSTYTVKPADDHHQLYVFESVSAPHLKTLEWFGNDYKVNPGLISAHPTPLISGAVKVGSKLTAHPGSWSPSTVKLTYRWYRSGAAISGATRSTYTPTSSDLNRTIAVRVTGSKAAYTTVGESSAALVVAPGAFTKAPTPTISGTPVVGSVLTSRRGTWSPSSSVSYGYQWLANGIPIAGATGAAYRLASRDAGNQISLRITANKSAYTTTVRTSAPIAIILKKLTAGTPKITEMARVRVTGTLSGYAAALVYSAVSGRVS